MIADDPRTSSDESLEPFNKKIWDKDRKTPIPFMKPPDSTGGPTIFLKETHNA